MMIKNYCTLKGLNGHFFDTGKGHSFYDKYDKGYSFHENQNKGYCCI